MILFVSMQNSLIWFKILSCISYFQGVGRALFMELRKRLQSVGVCSIICWGDKESEGFWHKQVIAESCFPGSKQQKDQSST